MNLRSVFFIFLLGFMSLLFSACDSEIDYYSQVQKFCSSPVVGGLIFEMDAPDDSYLFKFNPECKEKLEAIIPFDDESFQKNPMMKEKVLEAFYVYLAYPMAYPPEDRILGQSPGSIPVYLTELLGDEDQDINKNWFNHILSLTKEIRYVDEDNGSSARFDPWFEPLLNLEGKISIFRAFYRPQVSFMSLDWSGYRPFFRAETIAHEARHGDSYQHHDCGNVDASGCDGDLNGAYGAGVIFMEMLLHGSYGKIDSRGDDYLTQSDVRGIFRNICRTLKIRIDHKSNDLEKLLNRIDCDKPPVDELLVLEGLKSAS